jgi:hypothetical protein
MAQPNRRRALIALLLLPVTCGPADPAAPADAAPPPSETTDPASATGGFVIDLVPARDGKAAYTSVLGKVYGGSMPVPVIWSAREEQGGCQLLVPRVPFCSPGCGGAAACVEDGRCQDYPRAVNLGRVQVAGLGGAAFDMDAIAGSYQPAASVALPYPPFAEGAAVSVTTSGGGLPALTVGSRGIAPLALTGAFTLTSGQPLPVVWTPPQDPAASSIEVVLDISHHGGSKGKITCRVPDSGAFQIPASQVTELLALGVAGFPTIVVTRVASGTAALAGGVTLRVTSSLERAVEIPGLRSCTSNADCPTNQTCRADLTCG